MAKRVTSVPATGIALDRNDAAPLHRQLYQQLRTAILAGQLGAATRLPSTRTLAGELGVSRTTALLAYEQLRDEGYLDGRIGAGTTVAPLPRQAPRRQPQARPALSLRGATMAGAAWPGDERRRDRPHAFQLGMPDIEHFPWRLWARALGQRARPGLAALPGERDPAGYYPLRAAIAAHLGMARGVRCAPEQVIVVAGAQAAFDLSSRLLLDPGDPVWFEEPGYPGARAALLAAGARPLPVPVDAGGLDVDAGQRLEPTARAVYVTPSHQFPLGVTMSVTRRLALLAWARRAGALVLEDDYDSEFRYVGHPPPARRRPPRSPLRVRRPASGRLAVPWRRRPGGGGARGRRRHRGARAVRFRGGAGRARRAAARLRPHRRDRDRAGRPRPVQRPPAPAAAPRNP